MQQQGAQQFLRGNKWASLPGIPGLELFFLLGQGLMHYFPGRPEAMILGHSSFGGKVAEDGFLLHVVSAYNRRTR